MRLGGRQQAWFGLRVELPGRLGAECILMAHMARNASETPCTQGACSRPSLRGGTQSLGPRHAPQSAPGWPAPSARCPCSRAAERMSTAHRWACEMQGQAYGVMSCMWLLHCKALACDAQAHTAATRPPRRKAYHAHLLPCGYGLIHGSCKLLHGAGQPLWVQNLPQEKAAQGVGIWQEVWCGMVRETALGEATQLPPQHPRHGLLSSGTTHAAPTTKCKLPQTMFEPRANSSTQHSQLTKPSYTSSCPGSRPGMLAPLPAAMLRACSPRRLLHTG